MNADRQTYSRYQILCAEREAWLDAENAESDSFYYDGISFWRRDPKGKAAPRPLLAHAGTRLASRGGLHLRPLRRTQAGRDPPTAPSLSRRRAPPGPLQRKDCPSPQ